MRFAMLLGALALAGGCSSTSPTEQFTVDFPSLTVMPGVEKTQCVVLSLDNSGPSTSARSTTCWATARTT